MKSSQPLINKSTQIILSKTFKNFLRLKNYSELINKMLNDYNSIISEYELISNEYIQKLNQLSSKYSENISQYEKTLVYSDGKLKELLKLFRRIPAIFSLQSSKLQSIQVVISECGANFGKDNNEVKYSNTQFDELVFEF